MKNDNTRYGMKEGAYGGSRSVFKHNNMWGIPHKSFQEKTKKNPFIVLGLPAQTNAEQSSGKFTPARARISYL
jgi:hypothetical protein